MYLVSIYFDEMTEEKLERYIRQVADASGNTYMIDAKVPPHITISSFETREEDMVVKQLEQAVAGVKRGTLQWASIGVFTPYVLFLSPVLNAYLHDIAETVYQNVTLVEGVSVSRFYQPFQWMPHTTIAKKMSKEEMRNGFHVLQDSFHMFSGEAVRIGVAKTNPYQEIASWELV